VIDRRLPFQRAVSAYEHLAAGRQFGKIVLMMAE
jgi:NADPH:quinone reductase-like Zn-dependent oxidoreductase